jgi:hypothetical protein
MGTTCNTHGVNRYAFKILVGNLNGRDDLGHLGIDGKIILKWIVKKLNVG